jgi:hypothetical protein
MNEINKIFHLPKEEHKFRDAISFIEKCDIISSSVSEDVEGPKIEEVYRCSCGDITLIQKSIITNVGNSENSSVEIIHIKSNGCVLQ